MQILCRRTKNNPCLIGEPGVGKTAIVEGLAQRIVSGEVPGPMQNKRVVTLDMAGMVAGSKYRGEFEERMQADHGDEVTDSGEVLLFIDETSHDHRCRWRGGRAGCFKHPEAFACKRRAAADRRDHAGRVPKAH